MSNVSKNCLYWSVVIGFHGKYWPAVWEVTPVVLLVLSLYPSGINPASLFHCFFTNKRPQAAASSSVEVYTRSISVAQVRFLNCAKDNSWENFATRFLFPLPLSAIYRNVIYRKVKYVCEQGVLPFVLFWLQHKHGSHPSKKTCYQNTDTLFILDKMQNNVQVIIHYIKTCIIFQFWQDVIKNLTRWTFVVPPKI